jgi:hypothetical protein
LFEQVPGVAAEEHAEGINGLARTRFEDRDLGLRRGHGAFRVCHVEAAVEPHFIEPAGDVGRVLLLLQIIDGGDNLLLVSPELHVIEGYLGDEAHLDIPQVLDGCLDVGACRFDVPANSSEKVELPRRIHTGLVEVAGTATGVVGGS